MHKPFQIWYKVRYCQFAFPIENVQNGNNSQLKHQIMFTFMINKIINKLRKSWASKLFIIIFDGQKEYKQIIVKKMKQKQKVDIKQQSIEKQKIEQQIKIYKMRRRTNTYCQNQQPKQIDRFKKRNAPRVLFAQQVNYSMTINDNNDLLQKNSQSSKSSNSSQSKQQNPFQQFSTQQSTTQQHKFNQYKSKDHNMKTSIEIENQEQQIKKQHKKQTNKLQETFQKQLKTKQIKKEQTANKKEVIIIGDSLQYEQKLKGFKKGMRRRYSHKNTQADYMTY